MKNTNSNSTEPIPQVPVAMRRARAIRRAFYSTPDTGDIEHARRSAEMIVARLKKVWADEDVAPPNNTPAA